MTTPPEALREMGVDFTYAADALSDTMRHLEQGMEARLKFLRRCVTENTDRLAKLKEEVRTLPEQIAKWEAERARLESQTGLDLLRAVVTGRAPEPEQPMMRCPFCRREYPDCDGVGVVFCDPKRGGCGFCRHVELKGVDGLLSDRTVMVCSACSTVINTSEVESMADAREKQVQPALLDLRTLKVGTVCEATGEILTYLGRRIKPGETFHVVEPDDGIGDKHPTVIEILDPGAVPAFVPARVVEVPR